MLKAYTLRSLQWAVCVMYLGRSERCCDPAPVDLCKGLGSFSAQLEEHGMSCYKS